MPVSVIIVNYNSSRYVLQCLNSAFQFSSAQNFEWIVVDNQSVDNSKTLITQAFPAVKWISMNYNAGFARANNEGIKQSKNNIVLLLNPDTIILDDAIQKCFDIFSVSQNIAAAVQLQDRFSQPQITGNFFMKGGLNHLLPLPYLGKILRQIAFLFKAKKTNVLQASQEQNVDWISGAFMMVKKTAVEKAGMFDEDFFLYSEEIEWCSRLKKAGNIVVYGNLKTIHLEGETINKETAANTTGYFDLIGRKGLQLMVSHHVRVRKQFGKAWFLFHLFMHTIEIPVYSLCALFDNLFHGRNPLRDLHKVESYTDNVMKLWKLFSKIWRNKPYFYKMM